MSATSTAAELPGGHRSIRLFAKGVIWFCVFLGGFVINEPAPYDLFVVTVMAVWLVGGLRFQRAFAPLLVLMMLYMAGGILAMTQVPVINKDVVMYMAVSGFLAATSIFFAAIIADDPNRLQVVRNGYVAAAFIVALTGIVGYFRLFPGAEIFTLYDRAKGTFEDPNVFGPFLALGAVFLIRNVLTQSVHRSIFQLPFLLIIVGGVFLSFSRASWGLALISAVLLAFLVFVNERDPRKRMQLIGIALFGAGIVVVFITAALSIDAVSDLFASRAKLVQDYDGSRLGRFARHSIGFQMAMEKPFGIGAFEFGFLFEEDPHNVYLKGFLAYGWIGGLAYLVLCGWTLYRLFPINFQPRPWQPYAQCVTVVLVGHMLMGAVIDTDHWRHMYLLFGLSWGIIAAEGQFRANRWQTSPSSGMPTRKSQLRQSAQKKPGIF